MNLTPRKSFRESDHAKGWNDRVSTAQFQAAASAALVEMGQKNNAPPDMATAASYAWRMEGAKQFLGILMSLNDSVPERKPMDTGNLNHSV